MVIGYKPISKSFKLNENMKELIEEFRSNLQGKTWEEIHHLDKAGAKFQEANDFTTRSSMMAKRVLTTFHDDSFLYNSLFKIFSIFV
jgi:hypothetical protein